MGGHDVVAQPLAELVGQPFRQAAGVHEHQGGVVLADHDRDAIQHIAELLGGGDRFQFAVRQLERQIEVTPVADIDHRRRRPIAHQQLANHVDRPLRRRQADAHWMPFAERLEPFEAEGQMRAALVTRHGVDFVDNDGLDRAQRLPATGTGEQQIQRLGGGDDQARTTPQHPHSFGSRGVAGAHRHADRRWREA